MSPCWRLKKVINAHLGLAVALHLEMEVAMGAFVLSHIFRGMDDLVSLEYDEPSRTARGFIWMVQF